MKKELLRSVLCAFILSVTILMGIASATQTCPPLSKDMLTLSSRYSGKMLNTFPLKGEPVSGGACSYTFLARPSQSSSVPSSASLNTHASNSAVKPGPINCDNIKFSKENLLEFAKKIGGRKYVTRDGRTYSNLGAKIHAEDGKEYNVSMVSIMSNDEAWIGKEFVEFVEAKPAEWKLEVSYSPSSASCFYNIVYSEEERVLIRLSN